MLAPLLGPASRDEDNESKRDETDDVVPVFS